jgi:hypothetical protein
MDKYLKIIYPVIIGLVVFLTNCSNKEEDTLPATVNNIDVSGLNNSTNKYTIISAQPSSKPESNDSPSTAYSFTLNTVNGSNISPENSIANSENERSLASENPVYGEGQIECDKKMRQEESLLLASQTPQLSMRASGINRAVSANPVVGTKWTGVYVFNGSGMVKINTTCRYIAGSHSYFFIDDRDVLAMDSYLSDYSSAFDAIYEVNHSKFGYENDTDGNGRVIIIFSRELENMNGLLGYFNPVDKYPNNYSHPNSNGGDIFYLTTNSMYSGYIKGTLAHEFQHMIYFDQHYNHSVTSSYTWLNEALSQAAEYYNGYTINHLAWISHYLNDGWGSLSLTYWTSYNYGYGALFIRYLIDQYGDTAIKNMCSTPNIGIAAVEAATGQNFNTIFNNFTKAVVLSDVTSNTNPLYKFTTLGLEAVQSNYLNERRGLTTSLQYPIGFAGSSELYSYELVFIQWTGTDTFKSMQLSGNEVVGTAFGY